jgi:hypothetical protein
MFTNRVLTGGPMKWILRGAMVAVGLGVYILAAKKSLQKLITGLEPPVET